MRPLEPIVVLGGLFLALRIVIRGVLVVAAEQLLLQLLHLLDGNLVLTDPVASAVEEERRKKKQERKSSRCARPSDDAPLVLRLGKHLGIIAIETRVRKVL